MGADHSINLWWKRNTWETLPVARVRRHEASQIAYWAIQRGNGAKPEGEIAAGAFLRQDKRKSVAAAHRPLATRHRQRCPQVSYMLTLGISGSFNTDGDPWIRGLPRGHFHDAAAALVRDGRTLFAAEEERFTRSKHTHAFPISAIRAALQQTGVRLSDVDEVAFFFEESYLDDRLARYQLADPLLPHTTARQRLVQLLDSEVESDRIHFIRHHRAHAASAFRDSGFKEATVLVMDASGETESLSVFSAEGGELTLRKSNPPTASLGQLYFLGTRFLGFRVFDEYKVMGVAPYGDPQRFRSLMRGLYTLRPDGDYELDVSRFDDSLLEAGLSPRRSGDPLAPAHCSLAAALQEALETIAVHVAEAAIAETGARNLCLTGGVALNCTLNGRLARSGVFSDVFVHPAPHDGGAAQGAALARSLNEKPSGRLRRVDFGTHIGSDADIGELLEAWGDHLHGQRVDDIGVAAAEAISEGKVIGWAQGRAEFGPRALGQRSILADARPVENRHRINEMIKNRESFRPFAPAVLAERAHEFFELAGVEPTFMSFALPVRPAFRELLGAVTHVDGSARLQSVRRADSPLFWHLIAEVGERTGVPVVLNTSFNNDAEPIVNSAADAVRCFLTTSLDRLAIGSYLVTRSSGAFDLGGLVLALVPPAGLRMQMAPSGDARWEIYERAHPDDRRRVASISLEAAAAVSESRGIRPLRECVSAIDGQRLGRELMELWRRRLIDLRPH